MSFPHLEHRSGCTGPGPAVLGTLVDERARFLGFLASRVGDRDLAEDLRRSATLQALRRADTLPCASGWSRCAEPCAPHGCLDGTRRKSEASAGV